MGKKHAEINELKQTQTELALKEKCPTSLVLRYACKASACPFPFTQVLTQFRFFHNFTACFFATICKFTRCFDWDFLRYVGCKLFQEYGKKAVCRICELEFQKWYYKQQGVIHSVPLATSPI